MRADCLSYHLLAENCSYATILRGIETGWESRDFDLREYEDMLTLPQHPARGGVNTEET